MFSDKQEFINYSANSDMGVFFWITLIIMFLTMLWKFNSVIRYYLKFTLFILISLIVSTLPIPIMLLRPRASQNALIPAFALRASAWILGLKYTVKGKENIVKDSGCVIVINHQSALDLIVLAELWPIMDKCTVIAKKEVFYLWPFGLATWLWGTIFIDRLNTERAQETVNSTGATIKKRQARVLMFPEGTRNMQDKLLPFKKGAFHLALASQCPIQPVAVSKYKFLGKHRFDEGESTINILPPISTKGQNIDTLINQTYSTMSNFLIDLENNSNANNNSNKLKRS